jgi:2'-5' RNA ligase
MAETQRLFFALWPDAALAETLLRLGSPLAEPPARPVSAANLHLTLVFLGSVTGAVRDCLIAEAARIRCAPFTLRLDGFGHYPRPKVLWLGCESIPATLEHLVQVLQDVQRSCGLTPEARPFAAHVTLAREQPRRTLPPLVTPIEWPVSAFHLAESVTGSEGTRYRRLASWPLAAGL